MRMKEERYWAECDNCNTECFTLKEYANWLVLCPKCLDKLRKEGAKQELERHYKETLKIIFDLNLEKRFYTPSEICDKLDKAYKERLEELKK